MTPDERGDRAHYLANLIAHHAAEKMRHELAAATGQDEDA